MIKQAEMKEKIRILQKDKKLLESKLCCINLIKKINTGAVRYSGPFLKWLGGAQTNGPKDKKINDYAKERTQILCVKERRRKRTHQHYGLS